MSNKTLSAPFSARELDWHLVILFLNFTTFSSRSRWWWWSWWGWWGWWGWWWCSCLWSWAPSPPAFQSAPQVLVASLAAFSFSCNYMTIDWQSYDNNVTIIWQSCDNHIMILARVLLFHNRPKNCIWKGFLYMAKKINSMPIVSTWSIYHRNGQK